MFALRRGWPLVGAAAVIALLAAVAIACGGGGDDKEPIQSTLVPSPGAAATPAGTPAATPAATPTTAIPAALEEQLRGMVLHLSDMPAGFSQVEESFSTNEEVAGAGDDAATVLAQLAEWGRVMGHGVVFSSDSSDQGGVLLVDTTVSLYGSDGGASASFADAVNTARTTDWAATAGEGMDVSVEEIPPLDVADEMLWLRLSGTAMIGEPATEQPFVQDVVLLRVGRVRGSVSIVSAVSDVAPVVETMIRTQADNMAAGVE
jgi:hypothetical protein